jgi:molecular chaperone GrpE (heat shock protein)
MFDSRSLLFLVLDSLLGLGGIFIVVHYFQSSPRPTLSVTADAAKEIAALRQECLRLRQELQQQSTELTADMRNTIFQQLQTLLTNYPSVRQMVQAKPDLPAKNLTSLFTPLDNLLQTWEYEAIGSVWEQVPYDPQWHQPDANDITKGELVYVRFIGYRHGDRILCPAKVSRSLPIGSKK